MKWLKEKIRQWLVKEVLKEDIQKLNQAQAYYNRASYLCEQSLKTNREMQKMYNKITDVAVDVGFTNEEHSWAVICVAGKPEYVKFMPLSHADTKTLIDFLKRFKYSKYIIDSPLAFRDMLKHEIMR